MNNTRKLARIALPLLAVCLLAAPATAEARGHGGAGALVAGLVVGSIFGAAAVASAATPVETTTVVYETPAAIVQPATTVVYQQPVVTRTVVAAPPPPPPRWHRPRRR